MNLDSDANVEPGRCRRCVMPLACCVCPWVHTLHNATPVFIVRHHVERLKTSNTARLCELSLSQCRIMAYGMQGVPLDEGPLTQPGAWLVFPGRGERTAGAPWPPTSLVVPDGSWSQARRMVQKYPALHALPRLPLQAVPLRPATLRRPREAHELPTVLAVAEALRLLEGDLVADGLWELHERMVDAVMRSKGLPPPSLEPLP